MLWQRTVSPVPSPLPTLTPTQEELRLAVLQASWARDRRVGRRRLALRWAQWALLRYLLPALLVLGAAALVWSWLLPEMPALLVQVKPRPGPARPASAQPEQVASPPVLEPEPPQPQTTTSATNAGSQSADTLLLQLDPSWGLPRTPAPRPDPVEAQPLSTLKPENWLHSKEP
jgi:hypothetical protein